MKIAYIVPSLVNKGPVLVAQMLTNLMTANGHECTVFYFDEKKELEFPCSTYRISLWRKIDFAAYDIVHSHGFRPDIYVFLHKPRKGCTKFISTLHNYIFDDLRLKYNKLTAFIFGNLWIRILKCHNKICTLSKDAKQYYARWFAPSNLTYAYNSIVISSLTALTREEEKIVSDFKEGYKLIGINASLIKRKGIDMIIKVLPDLPNCKLFVVGSGKEYKPLTRLAQQYQVSDRVLLIGYVKDAGRFLPYYDLYAMPSRSEGFGIALMEAAYMKIPIVCSDIDIFKELFSEREVTFFSLLNQGTLVDAVKTALVQRKTLAAYEKFMNCYSPQKMYEHYLSIYTSSNDPSI